MSANQEGIRVNWHGHSCFTFNNHKTVIAIDPYNPDMLGYPDLKLSADAVFCSHDHDDHGYRAMVDLKPSQDELLQKTDHGLEWPESSCEDSWSYRTVEAFHDDADGSKRGKNTIHVLRSQGLTIAHLGDLGHPLSDLQIEAIGPVDLLLLPVGGNFTIDAKQALDVAAKLAPRNIAPMHYHIGYGSLPIDTDQAFLQLAAHAWHIRDLRGPELTLKLADSGYCFVFQYQPPDKDK